MWATGSNRTMAYELKEGVEYACLIVPDSGAFRYWRSFSASRLGSADPALVAKKVRSELPH
ncbi:hypothetical protein GH5_05563 [Leishmania sp. Ghana 2012 LV757]|uniref:hypothetical protein n=1 Tax=Leishmania sp. Ghana 2012 LV757 TaxID=2803181 RepID=UPI001B65AEFE|nr:hypothetical protein GH5_05563 [Leishmania sp. Ghana 2012 LV757]